MEMVSREWDIKWTSLIALVGIIHLVFPVLLKCRSVCTLPLYFGPKDVTWLAADETNKLISGSSLLQPTLGLVSFLTDVDILK